MADDRRASFTGRGPASAGGTVELTVDPWQIHLFSRERGRAIELGRRLAQAV